LASLGYLPGCAPSQLLHTCSLAEYEKLEKVLDFVATAENISVINILLVLNPKHSRYCRVSASMQGQEQLLHIDTMHS